MKKVIRLTEGDLHRIVKESINRILIEGKYNNNIVRRGGRDYIDDEGNFVEIPDDPFYKEYESPEAKKKRSERWNKNSDNAFKRLWIDNIWDDKNKVLNWLKNDYEELEYDYKHTNSCQWENEPEGRRIAWNKDLEMWELSDGGYAIIIRKGKENNWL